MAASGASIQIENGGFVRIHHEILERLACTPLSGRELRCLLFLLRKTYGHNKKDERISLSQWEKGTGIKRHKVLAVLRGLERKQIIRCKSPGNNRTMIWAFNKYWEHWQVSESGQDENETVPLEGNTPTVTLQGNTSSPSVPLEGNKTVPLEGNKTVPLEGKYKRQKTSSLAACDSDDAMALVRLAYEAVCRFAPPTQTEEGKFALATATSLIERFSYAQCVRAISTLKERNIARISKKPRDGIRAPLPYLKTLMEDEYDAAPPAPAVVSFALEEIAL